MNTTAASVSRTFSLTATGSRWVRACRANIEAITNEVLLSGAKADVNVDVTYFTREGIFSTKITGARFDFIVTADTETMLAVISGLYMDLAH